MYPQYLKTTATLQNVQQLLTTETRGERTLGEEKSIKASFKLIQGGSRAKCVWKRVPKLGAAEAKDLWPFGVGYTWVMFHTLVDILVCLKESIKIQSKYILFYSQLILFFMTVIEYVC